MKINKVKIFALFLIVSSSVLAQKSAKLITYRKGCPYGSFAKYKVMVDGKQMGELKSKSSYTTELTPGEHTISPKQSKRAVNVNMEAGKTYVVKYKNRIGLFGARPKLEVIPYEEAQKDSKLVEGSMH